MAKLISFDDIPTPRGDEPLISLRLETNNDAAVRLLRIMTEQEFAALVNELRDTMDEMGERLEAVRQKHEARVREKLKAKVVKLR